MKISMSWNAGRSTTGGKAIDNILLGASWSHWGNWPERSTHIYLGLWTLTIKIPTKSNPGGVRGVWRG